MYRILLVFFLAISVSAYVYNDNSMQYLKNNTLETIKPGYPGNKFEKGKFLNEQEVPFPQFSKVLKWQFSKNPQRELKKNDKWLPEVVMNDSIFSDRSDKVVWMGHNTFVITLGGVNFITDPVFNDIPFVDRLVGIPCKRDEIKNIDYILLSHGHFDHCDKKSIQIILQNQTHVNVLTGLKMTPLLKQIHKNMNVQEAGWYQKFEIDNKNFEIYYLPALHWYKRGLGDTNERLWGSFILKHGNRTIFIMGDSGYGDHFKEIAKLFPSIDICFMGVGAFKPSFIMKSSHTSPEEAVRAFHDLNGKIFVPMHYGTFDLADEPLSEPATTLDSMYRHGLIKGELKMLKIGEHWSL